MPWLNGFLCEIAGCHWLVSQLEGLLIGSLCSAAGWHRNKEQRAGIMIHMIKIKAKVKKMGEKILTCHVLNLNLPLRDSFKLKHLWSLSLQNNFGAYSVEGRVSEGWWITLLSCHLCFTSHLVICGTGPWEVLRSVFSRNIFFFLAFTFHLGLLNAVQAPMSHCKVMTLKC